MQLNLIFRSRFLIFFSLNVLRFQRRRSGKSSRKEQYRRASTSELPASSSLQLVATGGEAASTRPSIDITGTPGDVNVTRCVDVTTTGESDTTDRFDGGRQLQGQVEEVERKTSSYVHEHEHGEGLGGAAGTSTTTVAVEIAIVPEHAYVHDGEDTTGRGADTAGQTAQPNPTGVTEPRAHWQ